MRAGPKLTLFMYIGLDIWSPLARTKTITMQTGALCHQSTAAHVVARNSVLTTQVRRFPIGHLYASDAVERAI